MSRETIVQNLHERTPKLSFEQSELAVNFYDAACDYPKENFAQIAKRVMPRGWSKASAALKKEARKMFNLAR